MSTVTRLGEPSGARAVACWMVVRLPWALLLKPVDGVVLTGPSIWTSAVK